jgi:hypothetical protein
MRFYLLLLLFLICGGSFAGQTDEKNTASCVAQYNEEFAEGIGCLPENLILSELQYQVTHLCWGHDAALLKFQRLMGQNIRYSCSPFVEKNRLANSSDVLTMAEKQKYYLDFESKACDVEYRKSETAWEIKATADYKTYLSSLPDSKISTLKSIKVDKFLITIDIETQGEFKEYRAPVSLRINKFNYPKVVLGLPIPNSIACSEESIQDVFIDVLKQTETGISKSARINSPVRIRVKAEGVISDDDQIVNEKTTLDKSSYILNSEITGPTTIQVTCYDCSEPKTLKIIHDFRPDKQTALAKEKKAAEAVQIEKERIKKLEQEKMKEKEVIENQKKAKERSSQLEKFKDKCSDLGFSRNTDKNAKCVLELMR